MWRTPRAKLHLYQPAADGLDHAGWLGAVLDLDGDDHDGLDAAGDVVGRLQLSPGPDATAHWHRRREAHLVDAVVHAHVEALHLDDLGQEEVRQRHGEIAVGDGRAER